MLYDCNAIIGRRGWRAFHEPWRAEALVHQMRRCQVNRALVAHAVAIDYDPATGNGLLAEDLAGHDNLRPLWVMGPHDTFRLPPPDAFFQQMSAAGSRAVVLYPRKHGYSLRFGATEMLTALAARKIPTLLPWKEANEDFDLIYGVLKAHPQLRLILTDLGSWDYARWTYRLLEKFLGVRLETCMLRTQGCLEDLCRRFGPERLVFGTGWPQWTPGASLAMLNYADVPTAAREAIGGGNLTQLLTEAEL